MTITKDRLHTEGVPSLTIESEHYLIRIFYNGEYQKDLSEKSIDPSKAMMTCRPLDGITTPLTLVNGKIAIKNTLPMEICLDDMDAIINSILKIRDEMTSLQLIYNKYFNSE